MKHPVNVLPVAVLMLCTALLGTHIQAFALAENPARKQNAMGEPALDFALKLKKKIVLTQFDVSNSLQVQDISNIYDGIPDWLATKLNDSGKFLASYTNQVIPDDGNIDAQRKAIIRIADEHGAQLVLVGKLVSASASNANGQSVSKLDDAHQREAEIELHIYDGLSGERLMFRQLQERAQGDVSIGRDKAIGSASFLSGSYGQALDRLLDTAVTEIQQSLKNIPFSARIVRVIGKRVLINVGSNVSLKPGDSLVAYVREPKQAVVGLQNEPLGIQERAVDTPIVHFVQGQMAIAELTEYADKLGVKVGDLVKLDPIEQRKLITEQIKTTQLAHAEQEAKETAERKRREKIAADEAERIRKQQEAAAEKERKKEEKKAAALAAAKAAAEAKAARELARKNAAKSNMSNFARTKARANSYKPSKRLINLDNTPTQTETKSESQKKSTQKTSKNQKPPVNEIVPINKIGEIPVKLKKIEVPQKKEH